jgi:hypothetical protein
MSKSKAFAGSAVGSQHSTTPALIGGLIAALAGSSGFLVVPMIVAALRHDGVAETWTGLIGSADPAGMFLGAAAALLTVFRSHARAFTLLALSVTLVCNLASAIIHEPALLLILRAACGLAGGLTLALSLGVLARTRAPDRSFALLALLQMLFSSMVAWRSDGGQGGLYVIYVCMFGLQLVGIVGALAINFHRDAGPAKPSGHSRPRPYGRAFPVYVALGNFLSAAGFLMLWANIQAIANFAGLPHSAVVAIFDIGLAGGLAGALVPQWIDGHKRRGRLVAGLFILNLMAIAVIATSSSVILFSFAAFVFQFSTATAFYSFGTVSTVDPGGKLPILHILSVKAGFGIAPFTASLLLDHLSLTAVIACSFGMTVLAMAAFARFIHLAKFV